MHDILLIIVIAIVTFLTRFIPFIAFKNKSYPVIEYLGDVLPFAVMSMLVVYCLKNVNFLTGNHSICEIAGVLSVVALHIWKRNTLISIIGGIVIYMLCVQVIFI